MKHLAQETPDTESLSTLLNSIFNSALHGIIAFTSIRDENNQIVDFNFQMVNSVAAQIIQKDVDELKTLTLLSALPGNKESGLFDAYVNVVESGLPYETTLYYNYDDIEDWFKITAAKNLDGFIVTFLDISDLKRQEQELIKKQKALTEANSELERFAYIASHDLQEPLRKIQAFGDRLESNYSAQLDTRGLDFISRMRNASARMQVLIDDLLRFSRATKTNPKKAKVNLNNILNVVKDTFTERIKETQAIINSADLPEVYANETQMTQLFQNILSNALKYVQVGCVPEINITLSEVVETIDAQEGTYWQICISDNGIGFDQSHKEKIFEIFQRLHGRTDFEGTGIGLAICHKIVTNHNGVIFADSKDGQGATFTVLLPKAQ